MTASDSLCREDINALADHIAETAAIIDAAEHALLTAIRQFDEAGGWHVQGALSCAQWLGWRIGLSPGTAREKVRVARALGDLPLIDKALSRGELLRGERPERAPVETVVRIDAATLTGELEDGTGVPAEIAPGKPGEGGIHDLDRRNLLKEARRAQALPGKGWPPTGTECCVVVG